MFILSTEPRTCLTFLNTRFRGSSNIQPNLNIPFEEPVPGLSSGLGNRHSACGLPGLAEPRSCGAEAPGS